MTYFFVYWGGRIYLDLLVALNMIIVAGPAEMKSSIKVAFGSISLEIVVCRGWCLFIQTQ